MADACSFTGTRSNISDCTLGARKEVAGKVVVVQDGNKHTEDISRASWRIGTADGGAVKDYQITCGKGEVVPLSPEDLGRNPVSFKLWKNASDSESIRCSGTSSQGPISASGSMAVHRQLKGTFKRSGFRGPWVKLGRELVFPSFSRTLAFSFDLELERTTNGTLGMIHLVKSKVTRIDPSHAETVMVDTGGEFVLYTPRPDVQDPVQNQVRVVNGALVLEKAAGPGYGFRLEILQTIEIEYSYRFEEEYRSYLFFKGNAVDDIWHPVGFEKDQPSPVYMQCQYISSIRYSSVDGRWLFPDYKPTKPSFSKVDRLPEWNQDIHHYENTEIMTVQKPKEFEPIATEHNVDDLIPLLSLAPDAPELPRTTAERVAAVNHFLRSISGGPLDIPQNYHFANAQITTDDPRTPVHATWLALWCAEANGGQLVDDCTSDGHPVAALSPCQRRLDLTTGGIVGGHVVDGDEAFEPDHGDDLLLLPICRRHNAHNDVHMEATRYFVAVILVNFFAKNW